MSESSFSGVVTSSCARWISGGSWPGVDTGSVSPVACATCRPSPLYRRVLRGNSSSIMSAKEGGDCALLRTSP